jgi:hypothetical protein
MTRTVWLLAACVVSGEREQSKTRSAGENMAGMMQRHMAPIPAAFASLRSPVSDDVDSRARGQALYLAHCVTCHGEQGWGDGPAAATLKPPPAPIAHTAQMLSDGYLFYRISAISVNLPPLRDRRDDIMPLANAFLKRFAGQANRAIRGFAPAAIDRLSAFDWPGNVRQLQNEVQRAVLMCEGKQVDVQDLSINTPRIDAPQDDTNLTLMEAMERNTIVQMLKETGGNKLETAKRLGIGRQTLYNKIKAYGIEV